MGKESDHSQEKKALISLVLLLDIRKENFRLELNKVILPTTVGMSY